MSWNFGTPIEAKNLQAVHDLIGNKLKEDQGPWKVYPSGNGATIYIESHNVRAIHEGQILLMPRARDLITKESLMSVWLFIWQSEANISFAPEDGFSYEKITIIGDPDLENGISTDVEAELRKSNEQVERIACRTPEELKRVLDQRRRDQTYYKGPGSN